MERRSRGSSIRSISLFGVEDSKLKDELEDEFVSSGGGLIK